MIQLPGFLLKDTPEPDPEGANRRVICRSLRIDENDFFGLLEAMADKDFIGAVNIRRISND